MTNWSANGSAAWTAATKKNYSFYYFIIFVVVVVIVFLINEKKKRINLDRFLCVPFFLFRRDKKNAMCDDHWGRMGKSECVRCLFTLYRFHLSRRFPLVHRRRAHETTRWRHNKPPRCCTLPVRAHCSLQVELLHHFRCVFFSIPFWFL